MGLCCMYYVDSLLWRMNPYRKVIVHFTYWNAPWGKFGIYGCINTNELPRLQISWYVKRFCSVNLDVVLQWDTVVLICCLGSAPFICDEICLQSWPGATAAQETKEDGLPPSCLTAPDTSSPLLCLSIWTHTHTHTLAAAAVQGISAGAPSVSLVSSGPCLQWLRELLLPQVVRGPAHPSRGARPGHMVCVAHKDGGTQGRQLPSTCHRTGKDRQHPPPALTHVTAAVCREIPVEGPQWWRKTWQT